MSDEELERFALAELSELKAQAESCPGFEMALQVIGELVHAMGENREVKSNYIPAIRALMAVKAVLDLDLALQVRRLNG